MRRRMTSSARRVVWCMGMRSERGGRVVVSALVEGARGRRHKFRRRATPSGALRQTRSESIIATHAMKLPFLRLQRAARPPPPSARPIRKSATAPLSAST